jgi:hypothetical protein
MLLPVLFILGVLTSSHAVSAQDMVDATNPEKLVRVLQSAGYRAQLDVDSVGDPLIKGSLSRSNYSIFFYGCTNNKDCRDVIFTTAYRVSVSLSLMNEWNKQKRYTRAYQDNDGEAVLEMTVNLYQGVSRENFLDSVDWWQRYLEDFEKHINFRR